MRTAKHAERASEWWRPVSARHGGDDGLLSARLFTPPSGRSGILDRDRHLRQGRGLWPLVPRLGRAARRSRRKERTFDGERRTDHAFHPVGGEDLSLLTTDFDTPQDALDAIARAVDERRSLVLRRARYNREATENAVVINLANVVLGSRGPER